MADHKTKSFSYWKAHFDKPNFLTMQELLILAFDGTKIKDRLGTFGEEDEELGNRVNFINHKTMYKGFFCANFFGYEKGKIGQIIKENFDSEEVDPTELILAEDDGVSQQFLDGKLYFVCYDNHLIVAQDRHLKVRHLEKYLNDMFHKLCVEFSKKRTMFIERSIRRTKHDQIKGAKRINLSAPLDYGQPVSVGVEYQKQSFVVGPVWNAIKALTGKSFEDIIGQFDMRGITQEKDIEVILSLVWKKKRRDVSSEDIDALANAFRHVDDEINVEIVTASGILKSDEFRISTPKSVAHLNDLPDNRDIFDKMIKWHRILVQAGDI